MAQENKASSLQTPQQSSAEDKIYRILPWAVLAVLLLVHFLFIMHYYVPAYSDLDANGYWAQGGLLLSDGHTWFRAESDLQYIGMHWLVTPDDRYFSRYPPGLGILIALFGLFGYKAAFLVNPVMATLALAGLFLLLRRKLDPVFSLAGVAVLAMNPPFNSHALTGFAHMAVLCFLAWGLYFLLRWADEGTLWTAFAAGLLLGFIPCIRYPEGLFAIGICVFILWDVRSPNRPWKQYAAVFAGALVTVVPLCIRNQSAFGAFWRTGYFLTNEQTGFGWDYFTSHFTGYVWGLQAESAGLLFGLGITGIVMMMFCAAWQRTGVLLALLVVPSTLLYMAYYWGAGGGMGMRFLLPIVICFIIPGLWALRQLTLNMKPYAAYSVLCTVLFFQAAWGGFGMPDNPDQIRYQKEILAVAADALTGYTEKGDVVLADQDLLQHLDSIHKWKLADMRFMTRKDDGGIRNFGRHDNIDPEAPSPRQAEKTKDRQGLFVGMGLFDREYVIAETLRAWAGMHRVVYIGTETALGQMKGVWFNPGMFSITARVEIPDMPEQVQRNVRQYPGAWASRTQQGGGFPGMGGRGFPAGGFVGWGRFNGEKELVIAEWTYGAERKLATVSTPINREHVIGRVDKLHALVSNMSTQGRRVDFFWPPERENRIRQLMQDQKFDEASALLDEALRDYRKRSGTQ